MYTYYTLYCCIYSTDTYAFCRGTVINSFLCSITTIFRDLACTRNILYLNTGLWDVGTFFEFTRPCVTKTDNKTTLNHY